MAFSHNQLQFNTGVPTYTENLAFRHHRPGAIVIEKPSGQQAFSAFPNRQNVSYVTRGKYHENFTLRFLIQLFFSVFPLIVFFRRWYIVYIYDLRFF